MRKIIRQKLLCVFKYTCCDILLLQKTHVKNLSIAIAIARVQLEVTK